MEIKFRFRIQGKNYFNQDKFGGTMSDMLETNPPTPVRIEENSHKRGNLPMATMNPIPKFTRKEKLLAQLTYNPGVMVGAYGLYLHHKALGIGYLLGAYTGILLLVRYTICPRCTHLHAANDCVNLPAPIMKRIVSMRRKGTLNIFEKSLFLTVLYGTLIFPIYWLSSNMAIMTAFVILYGGHLLLLRMHFCKNCKNQSCIQNFNS